MVAKMARIDALPVALPMTRPVKMSGEEIVTSASVLVRAEDERGAVGWGEAASAPAMTGETIESMTAAVGHVAPYLIGLPADGFEPIHAEMDWRLYGNHAAKAAIDIAVHDLVARARNVPVHALLGTQHRDRISVLWAIATGSTEADLREAAQQAAAGFVAYKIKVGAHDPRADAERTAQICTALGSGKLISADANQGWMPDQAVAFVRAVESTALDFLEQPVRGADLEGMAQVAAASRVPIGADEGIHSLDDIARHHGAGAARGVSLKTIKLGGLGAAYRAGLACERLGMKVNLASKTAESSVGNAAVLHLAAVLPTLDWSVFLSSPYLAADLVRAPIAVRGGHAPIPDGPGLGVEVDEARVREFRWQKRS